MTQTILDGGKDDTGYYTPKNILNPAMFRLAEITRALSEVNMEIEQEKLFDDRRHTINVEQFSHEEEDRLSPQHIKDVEGIQMRRQSERRKSGWTKTLKKHEDNIGRGLLIILVICIALIVVLILWS
ncbi:unnamed protein product [Caenorhabditis sp. 36 PRJEB53466]|nr:unnamed protein product [Caenorhabditis sp. 36 PRJEB53466]